MGPIDVSSEVELVLISCQCSKLIYLWSMNGYFKSSADLLDVGVYTLHTSPGNETNQNAIYKMVNCEFERQYPCLFTVGLTA